MRHAQAEDHRDDEELDGRHLSEAAWPEAGARDLRPAHAVQRALGVSVVTQSGGCTPDIGLGRRVFEIDVLAAPLGYSE